VGFNSIAEGSVAGASDQALVRARARGFIAAPEGGNA